MFKTKKIIFFGIILLFLPTSALADYLGQTITFNVDPSYDLEKREEISATLQKISNQLYFYFDDKWWNNLTSDEKAKVFSSLNNLTEEFEQKIYPTLVSYFGSEWRPGIDGDEKITILFHPMIKEVGGYFNSGDEYPKWQNPKSNEREMIYLNTEHIESQNLKNFLAHEFTHLITFNQKEKNFGVSEEVWLNEARAEYSVTLLGYDETYQGSNLETRVRDFLEKPSDSLTEWLNKKSDYGIVNLFAQYLVENYGTKILIDSLHSSKIGIPSINEALQKNGFKEDFSQIFTDWSLAVLLNDCSFGQKYCYKNPNLKNLKITPRLNFLPLIGQSSLSSTNATLDWSANWFKIVGGQGTLIFEFDGQDEGKFHVRYLLCDFQQRCQIQILPLDEKQNGKLTILQFNKNYQSLIFIPISQTKVSGFEGVQPTYLFTWKVSSMEKTPEEREAELINQLLAKIEELKKQIAQYQSKINTLLAKQRPALCQKIENNLYFGLRNNFEVRCLQEFLKDQGPEIYPEGLVTGNFFSLTRQAVIRFQEKYALEILAPLGLKKGTGYVGEMTRAKINQLLK